MAKDKFKWMVNCRDLVGWTKYYAYEHEGDLYTVEGDKVKEPGPFTKVVWIPIAVTL